MDTRSDFKSRLKPDALKDRQRPNLGPSDSSDSASDLPPATAATDSDTGGSGERASVAPYALEQEEDGADINPDRLIDENEAGLAHTPPDPRRNGG